MTEHLAFDQLQPIHLSFGLSIAPGGCESSANRASISLQSGGECLDDGHAGCTGVGKPGLQISRSRMDVCLLSGIARTDQSGKPARQLRDDGSVGVLLDPGNGGGVSSGKHGRRLHE